MSPKNFIAINDHGGGNSRRRTRRWMAHARDDGRVYPWCTQGSLLHCYYMTREQCEQTVDYHGFCVRNPDVSPREQ